MNKKNLLSKAEMKNILGGNRNDINDSCIPIGQACNEGLQCCSNNCVVVPNSKPTGKLCKPS